MLGSTNSGVSTSIFIWVKVYRRFVSKGMLLELNHKLQAFNLYPDFPSSKKCGNKNTDSDLGHWPIFIGFVQAVEWTLAIVGWLRNSASAVEL